MNTNIEELLHDELRTQVDGVHLSRDVFGAALRRHRRRRAITGGVAGAAAVTAGALVATTVASGSPAGRPGGNVAQSHSQRSATRPALVSVAYVRRHILEAVDPAHAIIRSTWTGGGQVNDNWLDQDTGYITDYTYEKGVLTGVAHYPQTAAGDATTVDYRAGTYYVEHQDASPLPSQTSGKLGEPWLDTVADIKAAIQRSDVHVVGNGIVNGRPATHVRFTFRAGDETIRGDAWFDSQTYAPLRATTTYQAPQPTASGPLANASPAAPAAPGSASVQSATVSETTSFLPRTAANLAKTHLAIPAGFTQLPAPSK